MPSWTAEDLADLQNTTLASYRKDKFANLATNYHEYEVLPRIFPKNKDAAHVKSGTKVVFNVMYRAGNNARRVNLGENDQAGIRDVQAQGEIPWKHVTTNWSYFRQEVNMNKGSAEQLVDLLVSRYLAEYITLAELLEYDFWHMPSSASDSDEMKKAFGIPYWIVKNVSGTSATAPSNAPAPGGFNGANNSIFSGGPAGLDASLAKYAGWRNWTAKYENITRDDFVAVAKWALRKTNWKALQPMQARELDPGNEKVMYGTALVLAALEKLLEDRNDNLGVDLDKYEGRIMFQGRPVQWAEPLDDDSDAPFYGIDWSKMQVYFLDGEYLEETGPVMGGTQHSAATNFMDLTYNYACTNRRTSFVLSTAAANEY